MNPIKSSLRYPAVTLVLTAMVVTVGIHAFLVMPRMEDPDVTVRTGLVLAAYPGATSEQVEEQVTKPIEERIFKFPEVRKEKTFSTSRPGLVIVNVELEDNVTEADVFWSKLRHDMNEASATILPQGVRGPIVNSDFGSTVAVLMAIHGQRYGYRELRDYADRLQDELRTIRDIGKMATYGEQSEQIRITSSLERMSQYFADPLRIIQSLQQRNIIQSSGNFNAETAKVPLRTTGLFTTEEEIRHVLVDISRTGQPVYIRDFAEVERKYQDPTFLVRYDGEPSVLLSIEMQKGKNIVQLGEQIDTVLQRARTMLPPDLKLDLIANQPEVVKTRLSDLSHEFMLAIGSVILVTLILLPFRVAVIAALAIPVTICATLAVLDAIGIQLHQVTIAALIVVLGIVVDDAIVIADNYVELLDRKVPKTEAAWKCATEVVVPVLTATLTIISSFLPLLILSGSAGEFIRALPITVAVALSVSFVVAVLLTPLLCRFFIQKGLHDEEDNTGKKKFSLLDQLQATYNKAIVFLMGRKPLALIIGLCAIVGGGLLLTQVPEQFFPTAERNQFVIDVWTPQGSRIEATDDVIRRIEKQLQENSEVAHYASFTGQSAPRFYYNVNPQQPDGAYGQLIVNTKSEKETPRLVADLRVSLAKTAPEAMVIVKELQQGSLMEAPVEVRISGDDTEELKKLGKAVEDMFRAVPFTQLVHNDFYNDSYRLDIDVNTELSNRMGLTNSNVSMMLAGAFDGAPVSTFWEGNRPVTITLRLDDAHRTSFENVRDAYVTSAVTKASVPLRSVATLEPQWQTSRIVRRNGVQTLTVRGFVSHGHYGSELLKATTAGIRNLKLPPGYSITYGGEKANRDETFPQMVVALLISVIAIFLILLIQFRTISEPLVVMSSIPLALFGAAFGLIVTRNPFGFTAFMGLISLAGIVVRNAIILIDYINEKIREGHPLEQAATEAGERRLRPIFLTTMAAAVGVTPMILSGSSLWSPLASVIAVGLIFSMFFTLLVVPVLFVIVESRVRKPVTAAAIALMLVASGNANAATREITLQEAIDLALKQNSMAKIARAKVKESQQKQISARADYFPQLSNDSTLFGVVNRQFVTIPAGGLGTIPGLGQFPPTSVAFNQGSNSLLLTNTTLGQPLTQLLKIREANRIATSDRRIAETDQKKAENEITLAIHQLYYGLLASSKAKDAAQAQISAGEESLREAETAVRAGNVLEVAIIGRRTALLQAKQSFLAAENQIADLTVEMNNLMGIPLDTQLSLAPIAAEAPAIDSRDRYLQSALAQNPEVQAAIQTVEKARHATSIARYDYIPEIGAFGRYTYQNGIPFLAHNNGSFGLQMTWNIFDWGKRNGVIGQREAQLEQAEENLRRLKDGVAVDIEKTYRKLERAKQMIEVATEALALQRENERLSGNQLKAGVTSEAKNAEAIAATRKAEADELQARLAYRLAHAELIKIAGTPR